MNKVDAQQATPILQASLTTLMSVTSSLGRSGADLRFACSSLSAYAEATIQADALGMPLANCFSLARTCGITQPQLAIVRNATLAETPTLLGAILVKNSIVNLCLATEALVIGATTFTSSGDVEALQININKVFAIVEETAADEMDQETYRGLLALHASITYFLVGTARRLPTLVRFMFAQSMPTLITAMRLYSDANRADQLRDENKVVHPAFMQPNGIGLSV